MKKVQLTMTMTKSGNVGMWVTVSALVELVCFLDPEEVLVSLSTMLHVAESSKAHLVLVPNVARRSRRLV